MKTMNKVTMFIWGLLIFSLWAIIIAIAYKEQDKEYINLTNDLKLVADRYIEKNNIDIKYNESYKIYIEELKESNYINDDTKIKKYCVDSIVVRKKLIKYSYKFNIECKDEE